jgi:hypothetical protein
MITTDTFSQNWKELRNKVRQRWMSLNNTDIGAIDGNVDVLVDLIRERYGYTQAQAEAEVERFLAESGASETKAA